MTNDKHPKDKEDHKGPPESQEFGGGNGPAPPPPPVPPTPPKPGE